MQWPAFLDQEPLAKWLTQMRACTLDDVRLELQDAIVEEARCPKLLCCWNSDEEAMPDNLKPLFAEQAAGWIVRHL
jgi:hypothetical protein